MNSDELQRVLILGAGIMGRQIGLQCARYGYEVRIYDIMPEALQSAEQQIKSYAMEFVSEGMLSESQAAAATGRPDRFCALHFHQPVWYSNVVDIMPHPGTAAETVELLHDFARSIDQIPIFVKREHPAYVFNTMLDALLSSAMELAAEDVASV